MTERCDAAVIGAGVVGLAVARALARAGREVVVLERRDSIGAETSSRNSEVIHAGIYYPSGSLKAQLCVRGKALLYQYCAACNVPHRRIGKVVVATSAAQLAQLKDYQRQARSNGAGELPWLTRREVLDMEPAVDALAGVYSASTGIIDSHAYMLSLAGDLEAYGGMVAFLTEVIDLQRRADGVRLRCCGFDLDARSVVTSSSGGCGHAARAGIRPHNDAVAGNRR